MKITIIGKRDQMGTTPNIRLKGLSGMRYDFLWDKESRHYAYEPKNQKEADDIFRTQGKIYRTMFFSIKLDEKKEEVPYNDPTGETYDSSKEEKKAPVKRARKKKQAVEELA
jgi:hypothetical protein